MKRFTGPPHPDRGKRAYPGARKIFIEADAGGSNGYRRRLWKRELQRWANADGLEINVSQLSHGSLEMAQIYIHSHPTCPQWNYTIKPKLRCKTHKLFLETR